MVTTKGYDYLNRLTSIQSQAYNSSGGKVGSAIGAAYQYNSANQRKRADLPDGTFWLYQYDALGQVTSGRRYWADGTEVAGQQFEYGIDDIGNRKTTGGRASAVSTYTRDYQNKYSQRTVAGTIDILGIANPTANVTVNGNVANRRGEYYHWPLSIANGSAQYPTVTVVSQYGSTQTGSGAVFVSPSTETFNHDADGNLTGDGRWTYTWDGENRLIEMKRDTSSPTVSSRLKLEFEYDWQGRRIRKKFYTHNGTAWVLFSDKAFLSDGWNLLGELNAASSNAKLRTYVWGTDLSQTRNGAGGVGGLLKVTDYTSGTSHHFVSYDGNGNVVGLISAANGSSTARYEHGPFGEALRTTGSYAKNNPFRFSSKFIDDESGLVYYGRRYYVPSSGKWISRDPIGTSGGLNLYGFCRNNVVNAMDWLGLRPIANPTLEDPDNPGGGDFGRIQVSADPKGLCSKAGGSVDVSVVFAPSDNDILVDPDKDGLVDLDGDPTNVTKNEVENGFNTYSVSKSYKQPPCPASGPHGGSSYLTVGLKRYQRDGRSGRFISVLVQWSYKCDCHCALQKWKVSADVNQVPGSNADIPPRFE